jgi:hypothetical protein
MTMPKTSTVRGGETREMRLTSKLLAEKAGDPLKVFLGKRRLPGSGWRSWEVISAELLALTGEEYSAEALRRWSGRYGIPTYTQPEDGKEFIRAYRHQLRRHGIDIEPEAQVVH